jgi:hypothetical protein
LLDVDLVAIELEKSSEYLWSSVLVDLEKIDLNELVLLVVVEISGELIDEVVHVAKIDQRSWIWELGFLQEILHFFWVVVGGLSDDSLDFLVVAES